QFSYLHFKNSLGTDFKVGLPKNHIWAGGSDVTQSGIPFIANMPTEEIFTAPDRNFAEGRVVSSMPLSYQGTLIENFVLDFKNGEVVNYSAEKGYDSLKNMLESFDGAKRLGEVALVQYDSPISRMGIIFFNTLFDENASCHLALGKAYPASIENGTNMSEEELERHGLNNSLTHVDFMIGTPDLEITGYDEKDNPTPIFRNGNFVI
ncbi:MAG TPA: aminopeptidase, partial [Clostridia bacterium]|nr:aminopeptidase [Clostridia bacterium]